MIPVGNYLLQMSCWLVAFWLVYTLVLKKETYFKLNRFFLNFGLVVAVIMPLFPVSYPIQMVPQPLTTQLTPLNLVPSLETESNINYWIIAYVLGALFFFARFFIQHFNLYLLRKKSKAVVVNSLKVYQLEKDTAPFSFFNQIYVSSKMSSSTELETVVTHEKVHIHERHWADLLLLEVVRTVQWFNPLMQLYRKAMMQNHEYLADSGTLEFGVSARTYRAVLVNQMLGLPVVSYANSFTFSNSSNRLLMMKKNKSNSRKRLKFLLILPLIFIILVGFAKPKYVNENNNLVAQEGNLKITGKVLDNNGEPLPGASIVVSNSNYGTVSNLDGKFILDAVKSNDNIVVSFVGYETIVLPVKKEMNFNMEKKVIAIEIRKEKIAPPPPAPANLTIRGVTSTESSKGNAPLIVIDGQISEVDFNTIDPESIEKMEISYDEATKAFYGLKGKNQLMVITTKNKNGGSEISPPPTPIFAIESINNKTPLVVLDGKITSIDVNKIDSESIESINVLKDKAAVDKYGKKGKNGVVEISTKKEESRISPKEETFIVVEDMPQYPGGKSALEQYILEKTANSLEKGKVYVTFVINQKGKATNLRVLHSSNTSLNEKAITIVKGMEDWTPGKQRGKPVKVSYTITIEF